MNIEPTPIPPAEKAPLEQGLKYRTLTSLAWMFSGTVVQVVMRTVVTVVMARLLTPEDYGLVGAALIVVNFANLFSQLGVGPALVQRPTLEERHIRTGFSMFILFGLLSGGLIAGGAPLIANFFQEPKLVPILWVAALAFPLQGLGAVPTALLTRELKFRRIASINVITFFVGQGVVGIILAWLGYGPWSLVLGQMTQFVLNVIIVLFVQPFTKKPQFEREAFRELIFFGGGLTLGQLLAYVAENGDYAVVGRWLGSTALGIYNRAFNLLILPASFFGAVLDQVLFPSMAKIQDDQERLQMAFNYGMSLVALVMLPVTVVAIVLAPEVIAVMLGPAWGEVVLPFQILAVGMHFRTAGRINSAVARATGEIYKRAWREGVNMVCVIVGAFIGKEWGVSGVATGVLVALTVNYLLMTQFSLSLISMSWGTFLVAHKSPLLLGGITLLLVWPLTAVLRLFTVPSILVLLVAGGVTGGVLLLLLRFMPTALLGPNGMWMLDLITSFAKRKLKRGKGQQAEGVAGE